MKDSEHKEGVDRSKSAFPYLLRVSQGAAAGGHGAVPGRRASGSKNCSAVAQQEGTHLLSVCMCVWANLINISCRVLRPPLKR